MEKISGIIPGSARVTSVDMRESSPVRPGTPHFGRAEGSSSLKDAAKLASLGAGDKGLGNAGKALGTAEKASDAQAELTDWRSKDAQHAALATQLSDKFFIRNQKAAEPMKDAQPEFNMPALRANEFAVSSRPSGFKTDESGSFRANSRPSTSSFVDINAEDEMAQPVLRQPEGLYPKGSFIDRTA